MTEQTAFKWSIKGRFYVNLVETHSRLFFELASNWTLRICLDQIDYGEFSGDVGFYEKSSRDVIITLLIFQKRVLTSSDPTLVLAWAPNNYKTIKFKPLFHNQAVSTV